MSTSTKPKKKSKKKSKGGKKTQFKRVLIKLSGEALAGETKDIIDTKVMTRTAHEIIDLTNHNVQVAVVVGGGNIWRGREGVGGGMDQAQADYMGMLATVMNALALQDVLEQLEQPTRVMSAIHMAQVAEPYIRRRAIRHLEKGRVTIFAGGTGYPFFTTDTTAALRAIEIGADAILMAKNLPTNIKGGLYSADPRKDPNARRYKTVSYLEVINLGGMDSTAATMCRDKDMPILVFHGQKPGELARVLANPNRGTLIKAA